MAKVKNKRNNGLADKVQNKRKTELNKKKTNPFEVHINREKIKVLGKKSKHDKGLPGVSRAKAIKKRKETLGTEMRLMNKTNTFIDRRIGEKDTQLSAEDRMIARFAAERTKQHSKKNIYNLADDEVLTHRGQTLEQIEKFDDPRSDDEDEEGMGKGFGGLHDDFVAEGHFGGGMLRTEAKDGAKSHKDLIEQLIAESKKRKAEKQKEKEQTLDLTEKLDSEWKDLQPVVFKRQKVEEESLIDKVLSQAEKKGADYDKMMRELRFEKRGTPSDGLKNDEKQAKEERLKLEQWEKELRQRMEGEEIKKTPSNVKHRSAEDLEDNFELEDEKEFMLAYDKDGKPLVPEHILKDFSVPNAKPNFEDGVSDTSEDDDDESEESDDENKAQNISKDESSDDESDDSVTNANADANAEEIKKIKNDGSIILSNGQEESSDDDDDKSQVLTKPENKQKEQKHKVQKEQATMKTEKEQIKPTVKVTESILFPNGNDDGEESNDDDGDDDDDGDKSDDESSDEETPAKDDFDDLKSSDESEVEMNQSEVEEKIKVFFDKKTMEGDNLKELLSDKTPAQQCVTMHKLIKKYDPSLSEHNKEHLSRLFAHLLQFTNDLFTQVTEEGQLIKAFLTFDRLVPYFYDLAKTNKISTKKYLIELLKEKRERYRKSPKKIPDLDTLIFFKLVGRLYPTSDFRHPVTTPSLIFMSEILTYSVFSDTYSISRGVFLTAIILEYTVLSKRLVPSALNFLRGILYLAANTSIINPIQLVPPFKTTDSKVLLLETDCSKMAAVNKMAAKDLVASEITDDFKIRTLSISTRMTKEFFDNLSDLEAQECLFEAHIKLIGRIDLENYPKKVNKFVTDIVKDMKDSLEVKTYTPLSLEKKRPKALRLYEPDVQDVFTGSKNPKLSREEASRKRLQVKYKKEMKGALREIRRDKAYVASVKIRQKIASDNIRKDKVKQIYKDASIQQGELNKLKRGK